MLMYTRIFGPTFTTAVPHFGLQKKKSKSELKEYFFKKMLEIQIQNFNPSLPSPTLRSMFNISGKYLCYSQQLPPISVGALKSSLLLLIKKYIKAA